MFSFLKSSSIGQHLLILCFTHFIFDSFSGIWPIYKTICGIDIEKAGLLAGIGGFIGEGLQIVFGYFSDKGLRKYILLFGLFIGSSIVWITYAEGLLTYFLILLFLNIGSGSFHPAAVGYAGSLTVSHKGKSILLFAAAGLCGLACSQLVFTKLISANKNHSLFLLLPALAAFIWMLSHSFPQENTSKTFSLRQLLFHFRENKKTLILLYFAQLFSYALSLSIVFLLPDILTIKTTLSWLKMGGGHFCFILGAALSLPFIGHLCDKLGQRIMILYALSSSLLLFYLLTFTRYLGAVEGTLLLFFLGASLISINSMIVSWGHKVAPASPSSISALLMGLAWCFSHMGPLVSGALYKSFSSHPEIYTLSILGSLLILSLGCIWLIPSKELVSESGT
jgi:FSR family fosmidomycin resistance protein-like MFS transporter